MHQNTGRLNVTLDDAVVTGIGSITSALPPDEAALLASFRALTAKDRARTLLDLEYKAKLAALEDDPPQESPAKQEAA